MKLLRMPLPAALFRSPLTAAGGGDGEIEGETGTQPLAVPDPFVYQRMRWCASCGGEQTFVPVDRFPHGWRGYCLGCEEVVYVVDERTTSEEVA